MAGVSTIPTSYYLTPSQQHSVTQGYGYVHAAPGYFTPCSDYVQEEYRQPQNYAMLPSRFRSRAEEVAWLNREARRGRKKKKKVQEEDPEPTPAWRLEQEEELKLKEERKAAEARAFRAFLERNIEFYKPAILQINRHGIQRTNR